MAKQGKTLEQLAAEITRRAKAKEDFVAPAVKLAMAVGEDAKTPVLTMQEGALRHALPLQTVAHNQLAEYAGIPAAYYKRMMGEDPAGEWCTKCKPGTGCTAYDARPEQCSAFACIWLQSQDRDKPLGPSLRPDRCGVVLTGGKEGTMLCGHVNPAKPDAWQHGEVGQLLHATAARGQTVAVAIGSRRIGLKGSMTWEWTESQPKP
jgi:Fe-S-cluster containining protein